MTQPADTLVDATEAQWRAVLVDTPEPVRRLLQQTMAEQADALATLFYDAMLADAQTAEFLSHDVVHARLQPSMARWLTTLVSNWEPEAVTGLVAQQRHVGQLHARINLRVDMVLRGARRIKQGLGLHLLQAGAGGAGAGPGPLQLQALLTAFGLIDLAIEVMSAQTFSSHEAAARTDEAYRSFAATLNSALERERQRTALLDWQAGLLQAVMVARADGPLPRIAASSFGLWIRHKAPAVFRHSRELADLAAAMERVDGTLLPLCELALAAGDHDTLRARMRELMGEVQQIRYLEDAMFEHLVDLEAGRDALTQLLNRRFLPAILAREIEIARGAHKPFAVLLVDVDHFKAINDGHGHAAGDRVLQHLAGVLVNAVRSGDFVFRHGGEEFLVVAVELGVAQALAMAEKIRSQVEAETFLLANQRTLRASVSIGVAVHDGHPDYQRLVERADQALYAAKKAGRNRCVRAD